MSSGNPADNAGSNAGQRRVGAALGDCAADELRQSVVVGETGQADRCLRCLVPVHHGAWPSAMTMAGMAKIHAHVAGSVKPRAMPTIDNPNSAAAIERQMTS